MRAAILLRPGMIEMRDVPVPKPSAGEMLIRVKAALTCGTDLKAFRRGHPLIPMPGTFGHEFSGVVAESGKGIRRFKEGDAVMAVHSAPCRTCGYCRKKLYHFCENIMQTKILGAFAEYILLPRHIVNQNVYPKPPALPFEEAALLEPLSCVVHGTDPLHLSRDHRVLIIGAGPIGLIHLVLLKQRGVKITVVDPHQDKLKAAEQLGADHAGTTVETARQKDFLGFDYVFECTGTPEVWETSVRHVRRGGTVILFGGCKSGTKVCYDAGRIHYDGITLKGVFHYAPSDVRKALRLLSQGILKTSILISGHYPLEQTQAAFEKLSEGRGIKYAIIP